MIKSVLRNYQEEAFMKWRDNNFMGLFEMATGTGKTITALNCAKYLLDKEDKVNLIILVPTLDLASQWTEETQKILLRNIILANSKNKNWYKEALIAVHGQMMSSYCIITTYATFLTKRFYSLVQKMSSDTILIADEVHNFGTAAHIGLYPQHICRRLGLSATPNRHFDEEGTKAILKYFHAEEGPTFQFSMADAIEQGYLCEYYYHPILVSLSEEELIKYKSISKKLLKYFNKGDNFLDNPAVAALLLKRKRIIHSASGKFEVFRRILNELTKRENLKYVLVYVPEGNDKKADKEDQKLINIFSEIITTEFGLSQYQFIGVTKNREWILEQFSKGKIAVLTSMKCLDEGVDVRRAEIAIFCSSTGNPRQFIQRRGRILRTHPDKKYATIYDMIVVPALINQYFEDTLQMEKSILQGELKRVYEFSGLALNHYQALQTLEKVALEFDLDIYSQN